MKTQLTTNLPPIKYFFIEINPTPEATWVKAISLKERKVICAMGGALGIIHPQTLIDAVQVAAIQSGYTLHRPFAHKKKEPVVPSVRRILPPSTTPPKTQHRLL